jgi:hypothetical protein
LSTNAFQNGWLGFKTIQPQSGGILAHIDQIDANPDFLIGTSTVRIEDGN